MFSWSMRPLLHQGYLQPLNPDMGGEKVRAKCLLSQYLSQRERSQRLCMLAFLTMWRCECMLRVR